MLTAAVELISRRNKDRPEARSSYGAKYLGYLHQAVNLMIVDVLPRPHGFSFPAALAESLGMSDCPAPPAPVAASYRVDGRDRKYPSRVAVWYRALTVGQPLPALPLAINPDQSVMIDLESTYLEAARRAYLA
jgi:hypothetical protein